MSTISKILEKIPEDLRLPIFEVVSALIEEKREQIAREEILKVWESIERLAKAQERSEERLGKLEEKMAELAEAQKKTEERLSILEVKMAELAEAQKKTEERLNELAVAQRKTEEGLNKLTGVVRRIEKIVGGHSHTIGHTLEDKAILKLPKILKERYGFEVEGKLKRGFLENDKGEEEEMNLYGYAKKDGERYFIIGEGKSRFSKEDLKDFENKLKRFKGKGTQFPIIITYIFSSKKVEEEAKKKGINVFISYELEE